jgi:penicillin-binding protein 2
MAIGQGMLLASPLQMARVAGAIGTGYLVAPRLKLDIPVRREPLPFSKKQLDVVREGMRMVVDGGTGRRGGERVAAAVSGKTGTAEIGRGETRRKNAWFLAFAPSEAPSAAVAMIIENGESGGGTAAPRVRNVLAAMFGETGTKEEAKR